MTDLSFFPWALNQEVPEGYGYPAEALRAQHYAATSGGTGIDTPSALKVQAQPAPDGTVQVLPGGATSVSTYDGQENQSYHAFYGAPQTVTIPPTGSSSGGRHDLVIQRFIDPDHEQIPGYEGEYPIPAEAAKDMRFFWIDVLQGRSATTELSYPHAKLAHIRRGPNRTTVEPDDIIDLRELANPQTKPHIRGNNLVSDDTQSLHTGSTVWPTDATHTVRVPEFATKFTALGNWSNIRTQSSTLVRGLVRIFLIHPDGTEISTQESRWRLSGGANRETRNIVLSDGNRLIPEKFRGQNCQVEMRGTKLEGPNVYMDGNSSWSLQLFFEQEVA